MNNLGKAVTADQRILDVSESEWKKEMRTGANYYHKVGVWVAIIFDPIFGITDYINIPESWKHVFILRLLVALITFIGYLLFKKGKINTYLLVAIPFLLISLQNAYTYSLIGPDNILGHNLNYLALFLGASLFLLWPISYSIIAIALSYSVTIFFVSQNLQLTLNEFLVEGGVLLATGAFFTIFMIQARFNLRLKEVKARLALAKSLKVTAQQKEEISSQNGQLLIATRELQKAKTKIEKMNNNLVLSNDSLESEVKQRTAKLVKANKEMDQLVYSLSHDFRTPMVNVKGLIDLATMISEPEQLQELISKMGVSVNRFDELLRDMMNYAVYWDEAFKPQEVDIKTIIENKWKHFNYLHKNEVKLNIAAQNESHFKVFTDYEKLRVAIYCLLSNAVTYNKPGGFVNVEISKIAIHTKITISDNGEGINEEHFPRVFDMFYRGNSKSQGAGMGLYIAKGIVEQLDGEIAIESEENKGTTVSITILNQKADHKKGAN